jgi:hypothetical protein
MVLKKQLCCVRPPYLEEKKNELMVWKETPATQPRFRTEDRRQDLRGVLAGKEACGQYVLAGGNDSPRSASFF